MFQFKTYLIVVLFWTMMLMKMTQVEGKPSYAKVNLRKVRNVISWPLEPVKTFPVVPYSIPTLPDSPKCAINSTFCENIDSYPYAQLKDALERDSSLRYFFSNEDLEEELVQRQSSDGSFICRSISKTVFPKVGLNKNNKWKFIVNQDNFHQGVRVETCYRDNQPCDIVGEVRPGYITFCRQKYIYSKLVSLNDSGYPASDVFKLPSACCCAYKMDTYFLKKFRASVSTVRV